MIWTLILASFLFGTATFLGLQASKAARSRLIDANNAVTSIGSLTAVIAGFWLMGFWLGLVNLLVFFVSGMFAVPLARTTLAPTLTYGSTFLGVGLLLSVFFG